MEARVPERRKKPGVCYAVAPDGIELPVVDVTHEAFALAIDEEQLAILTREFVRDEERRASLPAFVQRFFLRVVLRRSILGRGILAAADTYVSGMNTYLMKIGPDNLGDGYAGALDRRIAAAVPPLSVRLRLQDMSQLLAEHVAPALTGSDRPPLHLLNIAGGPAVDSLNALILLRKKDPECLAGRAVRIIVLDGDADGPAFGARALEALRAEGAPLQGLDIALEHVHYDWRDVGELRRRLRVAQDAGAIVAVSSEGGLFEYGSDDEIVSNLRALRSGSPNPRAVVGSVTRADSPAHHVRTATRVATRPRTLEEFTALASRGGWTLSRTLRAPFSYNVALVPA
jgi:hypothetical protein